VNPLVGDGERRVTAWILHIENVPVDLSRICFSVTRFAGFMTSLSTIPTGSRTHPWLRAAIPSGFGRENLTRTQSESQE